MVCDIGLRRLFSDSPPTCYRRASLRMYRTRFCNRTRSQRACPGIREDAWWRNARGGHRQNHPSRSPCAALSRRRVLFRSILAGLSLRHVSLESICPSRFLPLFHPLERGSPTASRAKRGWLEGKRICEEDEREWARGRVETAPADTAVMILF